MLKGVDCLPRTRTRRAHIAEVKARMLRKFRCDFIVTTGDNHKQEPAALLRYGGRRRGNHRRRHQRNSRSSADAACVSCTLTSTVTSNEANGSNSCKQCRQSKVKCSGEQPCRRCTRRKDTCTFASDEPRVSVPKQYFLELQRRVEGVGTGAFSTPVRRPTTAGSTPRSVSGDVRQHTRTGSDLSQLSHQLSPTIPRSNPQQSVAGELGNLARVVTLSSCD